MTDRERPPADAAAFAPKLLELVTSSWMSQAAFVAAELGVADALLGGPKSCDDLAAATGAHAPSLLRLLRALSTIGICREQDDGRFAVTPMGSLLAAGTPGSLRHWTVWWGAHLWPVWGELLHSVRTGRSARSKLTGTAGFEHLERSPEAAAVFNAALAELTRLAAGHVVRSYDFSAFARVVDVGGGHGELLAAVLDANPRARGVLFDMPHAIDGARRRMEERGHAARCEFVAGDFFASVPAGGDAYLLKSVLHDWDDARARDILATCRRALAPGARLLVVEQVMPERREDTSAHRSLSRSDLTMLVAHAAGERTEGQMRELIASAGLRVARIVPAGTTFSVVEAVADA